MSYEITVREVWYKSESMSVNLSRWDWEVWDEDLQIVDQGSVKYSEADARKAAEKAADLHYKQSSAKVVTYEYNPS